MPKWLRLGTLQERLPVGRIRIERSPNKMRVPDFMLQCVGFVAECVASDATGNDYDPVATGFFVNVPSRHNPVLVGYCAFVTAKHVAKRLQDRETVLLVNQKGGGVVTLDNIGDRWFLHPDKSVDVAVLPCNITPDLEIRTVPVEMFMNTSLMMTNDIGIGDEVYIPGLFSYAVSQPPTRNRNTPILRHGNIAMLPVEPIQVDEGFAEVYLIEARSIGGISGSPVFVRGTVGLRNVAKDQSIHGLSSLTYLLGLVHGHWDLRESDLNNPRLAHARLHGVNLGIAVVVPAEKILETIKHPELQKMWADMDERLKEATIPRPDAV